MAVSHRDRVGKALHEQLGPALGIWVDRRMTRKSPAGGNWKAAYPAENLVSDPSAPITVVFDNYPDVFKAEIGSKGRSLLDLVRAARNDYAQNVPFSLDAAFKAQDRIEEFLVLIDAPGAEQVGAGKTELMRARVEAETKKATPKTKSLFGEPAAGLKPWREVVQPHDDVARGKLSLAEFAANLYQVSNGKGRAEYTDPVEFFQRIHLAVGLRSLLTQAAQRVTATGGTPVVNRQTNFGGGQTNSMIALYHLCSGLAVTDFLQDTQELLAAAGVTELPEVRRAVIVGTEVSPGQPETKPDGIVVNTLWGEIAWRLGGSAAYELVAEADRTGTNPGNAMQDVFELCAPCLPRLQRINVLCSTVARGPAPITWEQHEFAVATGLTDGRYADLITGAEAVVVTGTSLVVRPDIARNQVATDEVAAAGAGSERTDETGSTGEPGSTSAPGTLTRAESDTRLWRFYAAARRDPQRRQRNFGKIASEIITNLAGQLGTAIEITVEIAARNEEGFSDNVVLTVSENARTLKIDPSSFESNWPRRPLDPTEADRLEFIWKDLADELRWLCRGAVVCTATGSRSTVVRRVQAMDSAFLHARALYVFFFEAGRKGDDARAVDFAPGWETEGPPLLKTFLGSVGPANKRLCHLAYGRSNQHGGSANDEFEHLKNQVVNIAVELLAVARAFANQAGDAYRSAVEGVTKAAVDDAVAVAGQIEIRCPVAED